MGDLNGAEQIGQFTDAEDYGTYTVYAVWRDPNEQAEWVGADVVLREPLTIEAGENIRDALRTAGIIVESTPRGIRLRRSEGTDTDAAKS